METQKDGLSANTLAAIEWLGMPEGTPFPLDESKAAPRPSPRAETLAQVELLPSEVRQWDDALLRWTQARCAFRERSWGSLTALYIDHIEHAHQTGGMFASDRETFEAILVALGFRMSDDAAMVYGLLLREDADAARWKPETAKPTPKKRGVQ